MELKRRPSLFSNQLFDSDDADDIPDHKSEQSAVQLEIKEIVYCKESCIRKWLLTPLLTFLTCGVILIVSLMYPSVKFFLYFTKVEKITEATHCKITGGWSNSNAPKQIEIVRLIKVEKVASHGDLEKVIEDDSSQDTECEYVFRFRYTTYIYDKSEKNFHILKFNYHQPFKNIKGRFRGIKDSDNQNLLEKYGKCLIDIKVKPIFRILFEDVINWFYVFQIVGLALWLCDVYYKYGIAIVLMLSVSFFGETKNIYDNLTQLRTMALYECDVKVRRIDKDENKVWKTIRSSQMVPGDIFEVPEGQKLPCDALMFYGQCVVNESMLTGESTPSVKLPMPRSDDVCKDFNIENKDQVKHFMFSGTEVIQVKASDNEGCLALAIKTGFDSEKGELIRSILFPIPDRFKFALEMNLYMLITISIAILGLGSVFWVLVKYYSPWDIILKSIEILFLSVPPELPVVLSMGLIFSMQKLKNRNIYCINSAKIRSAGLISIMVLDKTGTLTEDGLSVDGSCIFDGIKFTQKILPTEKPFDVDKVWCDKNEYFKHKSNHLLKYWECTACCHSLTKFNDRFIGDSLDVQMLISSQWTLFESDNNDGTSNFYEFQPNLLQHYSGANDEKYKLKVACIFDFSSELQRMSVIAKTNYDKKYICFVKGSPEKIEELSVKGSIPKNYYEILNTHTQKGKRVIALSYKFVDDFDEKKREIYKRDEFEHSVIFLGFLVLSNKLKEATTRSIRELKEGCVLPIMATGDNTFTGVAVGRECEIITKDEIYVANMEKFATELTFEKIIESQKRSIKSIEVKQLDDEGTDESKEFDVDEHDEDDDNEEKASLIDKLQKPGQIKTLLDEFMNRDPHEFEFACNGKVLQHIIMLADKKEKYLGYKAEHILTQILRTGKVYSRMSPNGKAMLVEQLQKRTGELVGMCGDGANDCTALKKADVGLSLSEAEASVVAPFTSKIADISNLVRLLIIGRACLDLSFELLKFIICYITIQFSSSVILYFSTSALADAQLLFVDLGAVVPITILLCWTNTKDTLLNQLPVSSCFDRSIVSSIVGCCLIQLGCSVCMHFCLNGQNFYEKIVKSGTTTVDGMETTTLFLFTLPQYIFIATSFHLSTKFRQPIYTNIPFCIFLLGQLLMTYWLILLPIDFMKNALKLHHLDFYFRVIIAGASFGNGIMNILYERCMNRIFINKKSLDNSRLYKNLSSEDSVK